MLARESIRGNINNMSKTTATAEKIGAVLGTICYWFIIFSLASFIFMSAWNQVVSTVFLIKQINWFDSMLLMFGVRSMTLCFSHTK
jgi:hypothetical protein